MVELEPLSANDQHRHVTRYARLKVSNNVLWVVATGDAHPLFIELTCPGRPGHAARQTFGGTLAPE
jgi:hypothetical protein